MLSRPKNVKQSEVEPDQSDDISIEEQIPPKSDVDNIAIGKRQLSRTPPRTNPINGCGPQSPLKEQNSKIGVDVEPVHEVQFQPDLGQDDWCPLKPTRQLARTPMVVSDQTGSSKDNGELQGEMTPNIVFRFPPIRNLSPITNPPRSPSFFRFCGSIEKETENNISDASSLDDGDSGKLGVMKNVIPTGGQLPRTPFIDHQQISLPVCTALRDSMEIQSHAEETPIGFDSTSSSSHLIPNLSKNRAAAQSKRRPPTKKTSFKDVEVCEEKVAETKATNDAEKVIKVPVGGVALFGGADIFGGKIPFAQRQIDRSSGRKELEQDTTRDVEQPEGAVQLLEAEGSANNLHTISSGSLVTTSYDEIVLPAVAKGLAQAAKNVIPRGKQLPRTPHIKADSNSTDSSFMISRDASFIEIHPPNLPSQPDNDPSSEGDRAKSLSDVITANENKIETKAEPVIAEKPEMVAVKKKATSKAIIGKQVQPLAARTEPILEEISIKKTVDEKEDKVPGNSSKSGNKSASGNESQIRKSSRSRPSSSQAKASRPESSDSNEATKSERPTDSSVRSSSHASKPTVEESVNSSENKSTVVERKARRTKGGDPQPQLDVDDLGVATAKARGRRNTSTVKHGSTSHKEHSVDLLKTSSDKTLLAESSMMANTFSKAPNGKESSTSSCATRKRSKASTKPSETSELGMTNNAEDCSGNETNVGAVPKTRGRSNTSALKAAVAQPSTAQSSELSAPPLANDTTFQSANSGDKKADVKLEPREAKKVTKVKKTESVPIPPEADKRRPGARKKIVLSKEQHDDVITAAPVASKEQRGRKTAEERPATAESVSEKSATLPNGEILNEAKARVGRKAEKNASLSTSVANRGDSSGAASSADLGSNHPNENFPRNNVTKKTSSKRAVSKPKDVSMPECSSPPKQPKVDRKSITAGNVSAARKKIACSAQGLDKSSPEEACIPKTVELSTSGKTSTTALKTSASTNDKLKTASVSETEVPLTGATVLRESTRRLSQKSSDAKPATTTRTSRQSSTESTKIESENAVDQRALKRTLVSLSNGVSNNASTSRSSVEAEKKKKKAADSGKRQTLETINENDELNDTVRENIQPIVS